MTHALRYDAPRSARIVPATTPAPIGKITLAQTLASSVSAGTEMGFYRGSAPQLNTRSDANALFEPAPNNLTYPMQSDAPGVWWMGYSAVGRVTQVGPDETSLQPGDLVWVQTGHKSTLASDQFLKLPADTNIEHATLIALIEIAFNGMLDARVKLLDEVVIFGMGTLGQLLLQMCKQSGSRVIAVDHLDSRLDLAKRFGADVTFNPARDGDLGLFVQQHTQGRGADVVFEVTGNINALPHAIRCTGIDGTVTVLSFYPDGAEPLCLGREFHHKRIKLRASQICHIDPALGSTYNFQRRRQQTLTLLQSLNLDPLITHRVPFNDLPNALTMIDQNPAACQAVVVKYDA